MFLVTGIGVAPGIAEGRALVVRTRRRDVRYLVAADRVRAELSRLTDAQGRARRQIEAIKAKLAGVAAGAASLFEAQLLMIDDAMLVGRATAFVRDELVGGGTKGPLGVAALVANERRRASDQHRVVDHEQLRFEERRRAFGDAGQLGLDRLELAPGSALRSVRRDSSARTRSAATR